MRIIGFLLIWLLLICGAGCSSTGIINEETPATRVTSALNWSAPVVVDNRAWGGNRDLSSLAVVNGNPAIAYMYWNGKTKKYTLCYKRATNAAGTAWGGLKTLVTMPSTRSVNTYVSMAVVNGNPAICFQDMSGVDQSSGLHLRYIRANDATGSKWGPPLTVIPQGDAFAALHMIVVNGHPAISLSHFVTEQHATYVRATDPNGTAWGSPVIIDQEVGAAAGRLAIVNGLPAFTYGRYNPGPAALRFVRATDANGDNWGSPQTLHSGATDGRYYNSRLFIVNGNPAIACNGSELHYLRALDSDGATWPVEFVTLDAASSSGNGSSVCIVNGLPTVAYVSAASPSGPFTLKVIQGQDADGSSWDASQSLVQLGNTPTHPALAEVAQGAGIAYFSSSYAMNFINGQ